MATLQRTQAVTQDTLPTANKTFAAAVEDPRRDQSFKGPSQRPATAGRAPSLRRAPSVREIRSFLSSATGKLFKRGNQSEVCLPSAGIKGNISPKVSDASPVESIPTASTSQKVGACLPNTDPEILEPIPPVPPLPASIKNTTSTEPAGMKRPFSAGIFSTLDPSPPTVPSEESSTALLKSDWAPELSPIEFSPTLSLPIQPLSPPISPISPPASRSRPFFFRRKFSIRSISSTTSIARTQPSPTSNTFAPSSTRATHERRRSKYLNDPTVLSLLDRKFEEALEMGFTSPPQTPIRVPSPHSSLQKSPFRLSFEDTIVEEDVVETGEDIFNTSPNLTLPTLRELEGEGGAGAGKEESEGMTLRLTLTPATALVEGEEEVMLESATPGLGKRMSSLGRILSRSRSRSRKVKI